MLIRRFTGFLGYVKYNYLIYRTFSKESTMLEDSDVITPLENILQETENPTSTKKRKVDVIPAVKALVPEIISSIEMDKKCIYFKKLSENAHIPTYGSEWAAGADLYSAYDCVIPAKICFILSKNGAYFKIKTDNLKNSLGAEISNLILKYQNRY
uniref:Uncharacterized protein n=1 Tax=Wuchereria bancrofti TaxID=6293 RepID=A0A1I8EMR4_WUCBA